MAGLFAKLKEAVLSLIVWAIVAVGGLLYFKASGTSPRVLRPSPPSTAIGLAPGYFATFDQLAGRLSEQEEFVNSLKGKKVRWRGYVSYVRNSDVSP